MSRLIRRLVLVGVAALLVVAVVVDRLTLAAAERGIAIKAHEAALLRSDPSVSIKGFPFLTQAIRGRYDEIVLRTGDIRRGGVRIASLTATFRGVHLALGDALAGRISGTRSDNATGALLITYADLDTALKARRIAVGERGGALRLTASPQLAGGGRAVTATVSLDLTRGVIILTPVPSTLRATSGAALSAASVRMLASVLTVRLDTGVLPFGLRPTTLAVHDDGLALTARATGLAVRVPSDASQS